MWSRLTESSSLVHFLLFLLLLLLLSSWIIFNYFIIVYAECAKFMNRIVFFPSFLSYSTQTLLLCRGREREMITFMNLLTSSYKKISLGKFFVESYKLKGNSFILENNLFSLLFCHDSARELWDDLENLWGGFNLKIIFDDLIRIKSQHNVFLI